MIGPISYATWKKHVAAAIQTTDGVWGPSTQGMKKVDPKALPGPLARAYAKSQRTADGTIDVFTRQVDGKPVYLFREPGDGFTSFSLRDGAGRSLKMGDRPHQKLPLPHSEEPSSPVSRERWLADLKDAMRYPVQVSDTPVVTGAQIPPKIRDVISQMKTEKDEYGCTVYRSFQVHKVRVDGVDSYLVCGDMDEAVSETLYTPDGVEIRLDDAQPLPRHI